MAAWYDRYESQCWYTNTFLVNEFRQIGRAKGGLREWNNVYGSGCNFVCIAMMLGLNPAYLASLLASQRFFRLDRFTPASLLAPPRGPKASDVAYLVWDDNGPYPEGATLKLSRIWHPKLGRASCQLRFLGIKTARGIVDGNRIVREARATGLHLICGWDDHSHLVAGSHRGRFFVWDPVCDERHWYFKLSVEDNVAGRYSLKRFFEIRAQEKEFRGLPAQFWLYRLTWRRLASRKRPPRRARSDGKSD
jgi:hypothetical protein